MQRNIKTMKKILWVLLSVMHFQADANVKVFINNSSKCFLVRVYDEKNNATALTLDPGELQDLFLQAETIDKIIIQNDKNSSQPLAGMTRHVLRKETSAINDNMVFIISQDASVKMYKGTTSRDEVLRKVDDAYIKNSKLPTIDLSIHTIKTDQPWTMQNINYSVKSDKSFLWSIESIFS